MGRIEEARRSLCLLLQASTTEDEKADLISDLAAVSAASGRYAAARAGWRQSTKLCPGHVTARKNLAVLGSRRQEFLDLDRRRSSGSRNSLEEDACPSLRVAILSLLFNWPSTGGGTVHTKELADNLQKDGHQVQHIYAVHPPWGLGAVTQPLTVPSVPLLFSDHDWVSECIQNRFREAVDAFAPDAVIIADSWNSKALLAEAVADYPYFLRMAALECLCPLNNVRLLFENGCLVQCHRNQLSEPKVCHQCVEKHACHSGGLHKAERKLVGFDESEHADRLRRAFAGAEAVLVVNPDIAEIVRPFCRHVEIVPSGFDPARFPEPDFSEVRRTSPAITRFIFAGLVDEVMKGFSILFAACQQIWTKRRDFELIVTSDRRANWDAPFLKWIGWQTQTELPTAIRSADVLVFPTVAQEALGRTAVEALGCGKPVIASRLGGLPWVIDDGMLGLLATPGDPHDLAEKMLRLMNDATLRLQMGRAGREKFVRQFTWPVILEEHYRPLFQRLISEPVLAG